MMHDESSAPEHAAIHTPPRWLWLPWPLVLCWGIAVFVFSAPPIRPATASNIAVVLMLGSIATFVQVVCMHRHRARFADEGLCRICGYRVRAPDAAHAPAPRCPECGCEHPERAPGRDRPHRRAPIEVVPIIVTLCQGLAVAVALLQVPVALLLWWLAAIAPRE